MSNTKILDALAKLDFGNDNHWTADGLPRLETVKLLAGDQTLTREQVRAAAPSFTRAGALGVQETRPETTPVEAEQEKPEAEQEDSSLFTDPETPVVINEPAFPLTALQEAEKALAAVGEEIAELNQGIAQLVSQRAVKYQEQAKLTHKVQTLSPAQSNQLAIGAYLAAQRDALEERRRRIEALKGVDVRQFLPHVSPIDAAMARKTGYGRQRPER